MKEAMRLKRILKTMGMARMMMAITAAAAAAAMRTTAAAIVRRTLCSFAGFHSVIGRTQL